MPIDPVPPGLVRFEQAAPSRTYAARVAHRSTLLPFFGPLSPVPVEAAGRGFRLVQLWRDRIDALVAAGWEKCEVHERRVARYSMVTQYGVAFDHLAVVGPRKWRMLNCCPAAFLASPVTPACRVPVICPHCWGRRAIHSWKEVDDRLFPKGDRDALGRVVPRRLRVVLEEGERPTFSPAVAGGLCVVTRRMIAHVPLAPRGDGTSVLADALLARESREQTAYAKRVGIVDRRTDFRRLKAAGCTGGFEACHVGLLLEGDEPARFRVVVNQVLVVPRANLARFEAADWPRKSVFGGVLVSPVTTVEPTRAAVVRAVADASVYPPWLLTGPVEHVLHYLKAAAGRALHVRFGGLHGRSESGLGA